MSRDIAINTDVHSAVRRDNDRDRLRAALGLRYEFVISSTSMNEQLVIRAGRCQLHPSSDAKMVV